MATTMSIGSLNPTATQSPSQIPLHGIRDSVPFRRIENGRFVDLLAYPRLNHQHTKRALDPHDLRMCCAVTVDDVMPESAPIIARRRPFDLPQFHVADPGTPLQLNAFRTVNHVLWQEIKAGVF